MKFMFMMNGAHKIARKIFIVRVFFYYFIMLYRLKNKFSGNESPVHSHIDMIRPKHFPVPNALLNKFCWIGWYDSIWIYHFYFLN